MFRAGIVNSLKRTLFTSTKSLKMPNIIVSDPTYVFTPTDYQINIKDHDQFVVKDNNASKPKLSVKVPVSQGLFDQIGQLPSHLKASPEFPDESIFVFGAERPYLREYEYLGWHCSESGMTCIIEEDPFDESKEEGELCGPVDKIEFLLANLQEPEAEVNLEEFPLFKWYGKFSEGSSSSIRVYACDKDEEGNYNGLALRRGEDDLINNNNEEEQE